MVKKNHAVARCDGVRATDCGSRKLSSWSSRPCQPSQFHRPKAANSAPVPPSSATRLSTLHTTVSALGPLLTSGSDGQLLV